MPDVTRIIFANIEGTLIENNALLPGVSNAFSFFSELGYIIIGVSNQYEMMGHEKTLDRVISDYQNVFDLLPELKDIYFCPDEDGKTCVKFSRYSPSIKIFEANDDTVNFKKPNTGMLDIAIEQLGLYGDSYRVLIGDTEEDFKMSGMAKITFMWASDWRLRFLHNAENPDKDPLR